MHILKMILVATYLLSASVGAQAALPYSNDEHIGILGPGLNQFDNAVNGSFLDRVTFSLDSDSDGSFGLASLNFKLGAISVLNIDALKLSLLDSHDVLLGYDDDQEIGFSVPQMHAGEYTLLLNGVGNGISGGIYFGVIVISPVTEGRVFNMLLAGLALLGLMTVRRHHQ
ncbi:MAG: hypothetical protein FGM62_08120 [Methylobacterium sp.]|nr:hypothetical protein [Methylobacterium sp.]